MQSMLMTAPQRRQMWVLALILGFTLSLGFIPTSQTFYEQILKFVGWSANPWTQHLAFPLLAGFFYLTAPKSPALRGETPFKLSLTWILPLAISAVYGALRGHPQIPELLQSEQGRLGLFWIALCVPVGEEWLFRGWVYEMAQRFWPNRVPSLTNPLPASVWVSSVSFSLWHLQNLPADGALIVALQILYTLGTGLWFGYLRYTTGKILPSLVAHSGLNLAAHLL